MPGEFAENARQVTVYDPRSGNFTFIDTCGRIDDRSAGWKVRSPWVTSGNRAPVHIEGVGALHPGATEATRSSPLVVQLQLRPDPLAR